MSKDAFEEERQNKVLKEQIKRLKRDEINLDMMIDQLEQTHIELILSNVQIDWDMEYTDPDSDKDTLSPRLKLLALNGKNDQLALEVIALERKKLSRNHEFQILGAVITPQPFQLTGSSRFHDQKLISVIPVGLGVVRRQVGL